MTRDSLYSRDMVEWYDTMYCDAQTTSQQISFLKKIFKKNGVKSVLDIACGTGRHAIALTQDGYNVTGIDLEPEMISYAKRKAKEQNVSVDFHVQDMRKIALSKKFDGAICLFTAFAYMTTNDDVMHALRSIQRHLKKDGVLVIDTFFGWPRIVNGTFKDSLKDSMSKDGKKYTSTSNNWLDPINNYMYSKQTHRRFIGTKRLKIVKDLKPVTLRLFGLNEMDLLLRYAGFNTVEFFSDFEGHRLSEEHHKRLIVIGRK